MLKFRDLPPGVLSLTTEDPSAFSPPPAFGPFRVLHQVGVGALGPVFRTYEPTRDRLVAVKAFRLDIVPEQAQSLADELSRATEAGLFHPSIVEPIAAGIEGTVAYRAEEYVAAESLDVAMRHYAPAPVEKALPFITQLAGAIDFARAAGVGHGALHPRDIFVTPDEARATGFGVVEALERAGVRAPVRRPYTAPERIDRGEWGTPADVFSLAAIAFELLTGRRPAGTGSRIGALNSSADHTDALHAVLAKAMDDDPSRRFPNALAFASALESASRAGVHPSPSPAAAPTAPERTVPTVVPLPMEADPEPVATSSEPLLPPRILPADDEISSFAAEFREEDEEAPVPQHFDSPAPLLDDTAVDSTPERDAYAAPEPHFQERAPSFGMEPEVREGPERSRPAFLPIAVTLVVGLLAGFAAGYFVGDRDRAPSDTPPTPTTTARSEATQPGSAPSPAPKPFSEQPVSPPSPATGTPAREAPPTVSEDSAAAPRSAPPSAPAAAPRSQPPPAPPSTGKIDVRSVPSRASVSVNGRWRGRTPLTLVKLPFGRYAIRVVQPGYRTERDEFALSASDASHAISVKLVPEKTATTSPSRTQTPAAGRSAAGEPAFTGTLFVDSRPQGANILLDGRIVGKTPMRLPDIRIGTHVVRLELPEHRPWSSVARVTAGQEARVTGSLERFQ